MRILIASSYVPPIGAGAEKVAWETAKLLAASRSNEVHLLTMTKTPHRIDNVRFHIIPEVRVPTLYYSTIGRGILKKITKRYKFDIIHSHMSLPWGYLFRNYDSKKIITLHGCEYLHEDSLYRFMARSAYKKCDAIVSPSRWLKDHVERKYGYRPIVISNGVDTSKFRILPEIKKRNNLVLYVGRMVENKGIRELIEVAGQLPNIEFWFAGKGPLKDLVNLPNTKYLGYLDDQKLNEVYNQATLCVFPSHKENFPIVALEALACGKAIIATKYGFSEIIDHGVNGLMINPRDTKELKSAILTLYKDPDMRKKFEANARKRALKFDYKIIMKEYNSLFKRIME